MKPFAFILLMLCLAGCAGWQVPEEWLEPPALQTEIGGDSWQQGVDPFLLQYKRDLSAVSVVTLKRTVDGPKIAAATQLTDEGLQLQATEGCNACHRK